VFTLDGRVAQPVELPITNRGINMGGVYASVAAAIPAVARCAPWAIHRDAALQATCEARTQLEADREYLAGPGKLNGYAALGTPRPAWTKQLVAAFENASTSLHGLLVGSLPSVDDDDTAADVVFADLAASAQAAFEAVLVAKVEEALSWLRQAGAPEPDGVALAGGCALNVGANSRLHRALDGRLPVYVPTAPSDCGLAVGAVFMAAPPPSVPTASPDLAYSGPPLFDADRVPGLAVELAAEDFRGADAALAEKVAHLIAEGAIVGVARGRAEHGPRALGHRSLLADPTSPQMHARLNRLKYREPWRPVAPIVLADDEETSQALFEPGEFAGSPFMSFAPRFTDEACRRLPAVCHVDQTTRLQSVDRAREPWIAAVLEAFARVMTTPPPGDDDGAPQQQRKPPVVCNTSFNRRGEPILNTAAEAIALLCDEPDLDAVVVESFLFYKARACRLYFQCGGEHNEDDESL